MIACRLTARSPVTIVVALLALTAALEGAAQAQMPDPRQMAGIPRPVDDLPNRTISVRLIRGQLANNITDHEVELQLSGGERRRTARTGDDGRAQFNDLPAGALCRAIAIVDSERLESQQFPVPDRGGIRVLLVASGTEPTSELAESVVKSGSVRLGANTRFIVEVVDEVVQVYLIAELVNGTSGAVNPTPPVTFEMQAGALGTSVLDGSTPQAVSSGNRVTVTGPFQPGSTPIQLAYQLASSGSEQQVEITLPVPLEALGVAVRKHGAIKVISPQLTSRQEITARDGGTYIMASGPPLAAGSVIRLKLEGLPDHARWPVMLALGIVTVIVAGGAWASVSVRRPPSSDRARHLEARREQLFASLVRLEDQRRDGPPVDPEGLAARRRGLISQLERIYRDLEREESRAGGVEDRAR